jgi:hypothetical protein
VWSRKEMPVVHAVRQLPGRAGGPRTNFEKRMYSSARFI